MRRIVEIERVSRLPEDFAGLLEDSERAGLRLLRRLAEEWASGANRFDRPGEALLAARIGGALVGIGGLNVDPYASGPGVGRVRHVYVLSSRRRLGIGQALVEAIVDAARGRFARLHLRTANPEAARLYERLGFCPGANDVACTHVLPVHGANVAPTTPAPGSPQSSR